MGIDQKQVPPPCEREEFEAWVQGGAHAFSHIDLHLSEKTKAGAWAGWQARSALSAKVQASLLARIEQLEAKLVANTAANTAAPVVWPKSPEQVREFLISNCESARYANEDASPSIDDRYTLSSHDFLEAVDWWADFPHFEEGEELVSKGVALTDAQLMQVLMDEAFRQFPCEDRSRYSVDEKVMEDVRDYCRAVERAHGIHP